MQISYKDKPHNKVDYYLLPNGYADVFLHRNETIETTINEEGEEHTQYKSDEIYFQVESSVTKEYIENNFDYMWKETEEKNIKEPTDEERIKAIEDAIIFLTLGGV